MVQYDLEIINQFAWGLYLKARTAVRKYTGMGCFVRLCFGPGLTSVARELGILIVFLSSIVVFVYFGYSAGKNSAFNVSLKSKKLSVV